MQWLSSPLTEHGDAVGGRSTDISENLSPQERMLRIFDEVASAVAALTREGPVALLFDDLQWADEDSIQLIRYLVRTTALCPDIPADHPPPLLRVVLRSREADSRPGPDESDAGAQTRAFHTSRRQQSCCRTSSHRPWTTRRCTAFTPAQKGSPFSSRNWQGRTARPTPSRLMDGNWTMTRLSGTAVPSSIQSLIERRLAQLSDDCRGRLADAGVLGRRFKLSDLAPVLARLMNEEQKQEWELAEELDMAVQLGLINEEPEESEYDFSYSHDQIRAALLADLPRRRQQAIHGAIAGAARLEGRSGGSVHAGLPLDEGRGTRRKAVSSALEAARAALVSISYLKRRSGSSTGPCRQHRSRPTGLPCSGSRTTRCRFLDRGADRIANLAEMSALTRCGGHDGSWPRRSS